MKKSKEKEIEDNIFMVFGKDKIGLSEVIKYDGRMSLSKANKLLADIGDIKAQEIGLIPKIFDINGNKRLFRIEDVAIWVEKTPVYNSYKKGRSKWKSKQ